MTEHRSSASDLRVAIVGASLGGLSVANVLHRLGAQVEVFEYFPHGFHDRGGALGAVDADLLHQIRGNTGPRSRPPIRSHGHFYGDLWQYLMDGLPEDMVRFGIGVEAVIDSRTDTPRIAIAGEDHSFDLVIGADGGKSTIRRYVTNAVPEYSGYNLWRGLVPVEGIPGPPSGTRMIDGVRYETLGFPFVNGRGVAMWNCGVYMMTPKSEVAAPTRNRQVTSSETGTVPDWFVPVVRALFGDRNAAFWEACAANGKVSAHPVWEFAADTVVNQRLILLGDAAHMASPRTGAGAYTAMVDAVTLGVALQQGNTIDEALHLYNDDTVQRGRRLWKRSRRAAAYFAPESSLPVSPAGLPIRLGERLTTQTT